MASGFHGGRDIALDLGTTTVRAALRGKGILFREPSVAAAERRNGQVVRAGSSAQALLGRTPEGLLAIRPLREGALWDATMAEAMLSLLLKKAAPGRVLKPRVLSCVPTGISEVAERAMVEVLLQAGAGRVFLMEAPLAAALGSGLAVDSPEGRMVVDVGGGITDAAVLALGGVVTAQCLPVAGDRFDQALIHYIRRQHDLLIGQRSAEEVKRAIGRVAETEEELPAMAVKGRCRKTGLPREILLEPRETELALTPLAEEIADTVQAVLERTPPELAADVASQGILLTGGGGRLRGLDCLLSRRSGIPVTLAEEPEDATILGLEQSLAELNQLPEGVQNFARRGLL